MELPYQPPSILRLYGITLNDYVPVEDVADERLLTSAIAGAPGLDPEEPTPEALCPLDKIPRVFTGLDDWPQGTNLRCWQCDYTFDGRPKFVPTYVRETDSGGLEFGVQGNMCTFNCAELWIRINYAGKDDLRWRAQDLLCLVYFLFTGRRVVRILPAPLKTEQQRYGGDLDEEAFWKKLRGLDPVDGLRDHTPGSVRPERDRASDAKSLLRGLELGRRETPCAPKSIWEVCGLSQPHVAGGLDAPAGDPDSKAPPAMTAEGPDSKVRDPVGVAPAVVAPPGVTPPEQGGPMTEDELAALLLEGL